MGEVLATQYPSAPRDIPHPNIAKVTFFSLHPSYGSDENIKRPALPERVTDGKGGNALYFKGLYHMVPPTCEPQQAGKFGLSLS